MQDITFPIDTKYGALMCYRHNPARICVMSPQNKKVFSKINKLSFCGFIERNKVGKWRFTDCSEMRVFFRDPYEALDPKTRNELLTEIALKVQAWAEENKEMLLSAAYSELTEEYIKAQFNIKRLKSELDSAHRDCCAVKRKINAFSTSALR